MAKKKKIVEEHKSEPVTNCDQSQEPVAKKMTGTSPLALQLTHRFD